jgi:hypothetical protein
MFTEICGKKINVSLFLANARKNHEKIPTKFLVASTVEQRRVKDGVVVLVFIQCASVFILFFDY